MNGIEFFNVSENHWPSVLFHDNFNVLLMFVCEIDLENRGSLFGR